MIPPAFVLELLLSYSPGRRQKSRHSPFAGRASLLPKFWLSAAGRLATDRPAGVGCWGETHSDGKSGPAPPSQTQAPYVEGRLVSPPSGLVPGQLSFTGPVSGRKRWLWDRFPVASLRSRTRVDQREGRCTSVSGRAVWQNQLGRVGDSDGRQQASPHCWSGTSPTWSHVGRIVG